MSERKPGTEKQRAALEKARAAWREKREQAKVAETHREQTDSERWQDKLVDFQVREAPKPTPIAEMDELKGAMRGEKLEAKPAMPIPKEIGVERTGLERERDTPRIDYSREVALRAERIRQEEWRRAIEEDEKRRGPNPYKNPRLPMLPATQTFRQYDVSEAAIPEDAVIPPNHAPKWVGMRDRLSTGKDSMAQVRDHQIYGYEFVKDSQGRPVVTELGVLMSASFDDAAARQHHLTPRGSMKTGDSVDRLHSVADQVNRRAGRHLVDIQEMPVHSRRVSERLNDG